MKHIGWKGTENTFIFASMFYNKLAVVLTLVSLVNLITATISISLLFIHQIFKSKKKSTSQSPHVIYVIELSNIWLLLAIELHQKMTDLKMLPANPLQTPAYGQRTPITSELRHSAASYHFNVGLQV